MNHLAAESRGVGGREEARSDLAGDSVNGVITTSVQLKLEVISQAVLTFVVCFSSFMSYIC